MLPSVSGALLEELLLSKAVAMLLYCPSVNRVCLSNCVLCQCELKLNTQLGTLRLCKDVLGSLVFLHLCDGHFEDLGVWIQTGEQVI